MFIAGTVLAVLLFILVYALYVEPYQLIIRKKGLKIDKLPLALNGLSILHISDIHLRKNDFRKAKMIKKLEKLNPDLIFITGDLIETDTVIEFCAFCLEKLKGRHGTFGVLGNHDYYRYNILDFVTRNKTPSRINNTAKLIEVLSEKGIKILKNSHQYIGIGGSTVCIIGVDASEAKYSMLCNALPSNNDATLKILLSHYPDIIYDPDIPKIDIVLAGHTHGGQIRLPFIGAIVTWSKLPLRYAMGISKHNGTLLHVSPGMGTATLPMRFLCRPEVTLFRLSKC